MAISKPYFATEVEDCLEMQLYHLAIPANILQRIFFQYADWDVSYQDGMLLEKPSRNQKGKWKRVKKTPFPYFLIYFLRLPSEFIAFLFDLPLSEVHRKKRNLLYLDYLYATSTNCVARPCGWDDVPFRRMGLYGYTFLRSTFHFRMPNKAIKLKTYPLRVLTGWVHDAAKKCDCPECMYNSWFDDSESDVRRYWREGASPKTIW